MAGSIFTINVYFIVSPISVDNPDQLLVKSAHETELLLTYSGVMTCHRWTEGFKSGQRQESGFAGGINGDMAVTKAKVQDGSNHESEDDNTDDKTQISMLLSKYM